MLLGEVNIGDRMGHYHLGRNKWLSAVLLSVNILAGTLL